MTVLFNPSVNPDIFALGFIEYGQLPVSPFYPELPISVGSSVFTPIPNLIDTAQSSSAGVTLNTNGSVFDGIPGYNALAFFLAQGNIVGLSATDTLNANSRSGYAGFTNYTIDFGSIDLSNISINDIDDIADFLKLEAANDNFPKLDPNVGFTVAFDLAIATEDSAANRAGFSVLVVSEDTSKEIELGFKTAGADRVFAQSASFTEAEDSSATAIDFSTQKTYWLSIEGDQYTLSANGIAILSGNTRDYNFDPTNSEPPLPEAANPYQTPSFIFFGDNTDQGYAEFTLGKIEILPVQTPFTADVFDDYIASYPDLIQALGYNLVAAQQHYIEKGFDEQRSADLFAEDIYLASHGDLIEAFGYNLDTATQHYIEQGFFENRATQLFIPELYLAAYQDLQNEFGNDLAAATRHYIEFGYNEKRDPLLGFDSGAYIASYADLSAAFGYDPAKGREHYFRLGYDEGRTVTFDADDYIASYGDLIENIGYNLAAGTEHYITLGISEKRSTDRFDEVAYLNKYADLQAEFGGDLVAATRHYIEFGYFEGRTV